MTTHFPRKYGLDEKIRSFHWTDMSVNLDGTSKVYQEAVDAFPVDSFADALAQFKRVKAQLS